MNPRRTGTDVIGDGKSATPGFWSNLTLKSCEKWLGIRVGNREDGNFRDCLGFFEVEALRAGDRANAWRKRIAGVVRIHDAAALHAVARTPTAGGIVISVEKAVAVGIGIDDAPDGAVL